MCESCGKRAATQTVVFGDGESFEVCEGCAVEGVKKVG